MYGTQAKMNAGKSGKNRNVLVKNYGTGWESQPSGPIQQNVPGI